MQNAGCRSPECLSLRPLVQQSEKPPLETQYSHRVRGKRNTGFKQHPAQSIVLDTAPHESVPCHLDFVSFERIRQGGCRPSRKRADHLPARPDRFDPPSRPGSPVIDEETIYDLIGFP